MSLPTHCIELSGADPVWHGAPSIQMAKLIHNLTRVDSDGSIYFRESQWDGWQKLRTKAQYAALNKALHRRWL